MDVRIQHLQPVMPPDPAPPPPPGADNSTAPGVSSQIQTTAQNETSVAAADGNMGTGKDAAGSSVVGGQDTATSTVIDGATAGATLVNTTQAGAPVKGVVGRYPLHCALTCNLVVASKALLQSRGLIPVLHYLDCCTPLAASPPQGPLPLACLVRPLDGSLVI